MSEPFRLESHLTCTACGRSGAFAFDGGPLCGDCTHERGSCCAGEEECPAPASRQANAHRHDEPQKSSY